MTPDEVSSTLQVMRMQESGAYKCSDYLADHRRKSHKRPQACSHGPAVDAECRAKMVQWSLQVVDFCSFSRETVAIAMNYLDRYLSSEGGHDALDDRKVFQLAAMTCLYTAIKIHEPEAMEPKVVANLSRGTYTEEQVVEMERSILAAIEWRMNPPTALSFLNAFFALLPEGATSQTERDAVYELAKFQTELAMSEYEFVTADASSIAFAAMLNGLETVAAGSLDLTNTLAKVSGIDADSVLMLTTQEKLYQAVSGVSTSGLAVSQIVAKSPTIKCHVGRRGSVHVSPRSVVNSQ